MRTRDKKRPAGFSEENGGRVKCRPRLLISMTGSKQSVTADRRIHQSAISVPIGLVGTVRMYMEILGISVYPDGLKSIPRTLPCLPPFVIAYSSAFSGFEAKKKSTRYDPLGTDVGILAVEYRSVHVIF